MQRSHTTEVSTSPTACAWPLPCSAVGRVVRRSGVRRNVVQHNVVRHSGFFRVQDAQDVVDLRVEAIDVAASLANGRASRRRSTIL